MNTSLIISAAAERAGRSHKRVRINGGSSLILMPDARRVEKLKTFIRIYLTFAFLTTQRQYYRRPHQRTDWTG